LDFDNTCRYGRYDVEVAVSLGFPAGKLQTRTPLAFIRDPLDARFRNIAFGFWFCTQDDTLSLAQQWLNNLLPLQSVLSFPDCGDYAIVLYSSSSGAIVWTMVAFTIRDTKGEDVTCFRFDSKISHPGENRPLAASSEGGRTRESMLKSTFFPIRTGAGFRSPH
jgi:hypothetical protein